jgi:hypothetical protein
MPVLTLDELAIAQLIQATGPVELSDPQGNKIGVFFPVRADIPVRTTPFTEADIAEAERVAASTEWVPFVQIWRNWLQLATDPEDRARLMKRIRELEERDQCRGQ